MRAPFLLHDHLRETAERLPDKVALVCGPERVTFGELSRRAHGLARALLDGGVRRGDRVVVFCESSVEACVGFWAALEASAVAVMVNPQTRAPRLTRYLEELRATAVVSQVRLAQALVPALEAATHLRLAVVSGELAITPKVETLSWREEVGEADAPPPGRNIDQDLAAILFTSGSTGDPKGVMLSHRNMLAANASVLEYLRLEAEDVVLSVLPLSFSYGLYQLIMGCTVGARLVLERSFAYPAKVLATLERERATVVPGVPTIFALMLEMQRIWDYDFRQVRCVTNAAAALSRKHLEGLRRLFPNARLYSMYGQTECKRCTYLPPEDVARKPDSVGIPIPNTEAWVVDEEDRRLPPGRVGQLVIRGATVMQGYWERPEATAKKLRPGPLPGERVLYTGDLCRIDEEGYVTFVARMDDVIKSRGEKVSPKEVEGALLDVPGVREAAVIGVPDEVLGQAVKAFVVLEAGVPFDPKALQLECQKRLEPYCVPKLIECVPELPKTSTGKIQKQGLR